MNMKAAYAVVLITLCILSQDVESGATYYFKWSGTNWLNGANNVWPDGMSDCSRPICASLTFGDTLVWVNNGPNSIELVGYSLVKFSNWNTTLPSGGSFTNVINGVSGYGAASSSILWGFSSTAFEDLNMINYEPTGAGAWLWADGYDRRDVDACESFYLNAAEGDASGATVYFKIRDNTDYSSICSFYGTDDSCTTTQSSVTLSGDSDATVYVKCTQSIGEEWEYAGPFFFYTPNYGIFYGTESLYFLPPPPPPPEFTSTIDDVIGNTCNAVSFVAYSEMPDMITIGWNNYDNCHFYNESTCANTSDITDEWVTITTTENTFWMKCWEVNVDQSIYVQSYAADDWSQSEEFDILGGTPVFVNSSSEWLVTPLQCSDEFIVTGLVKSQVVALTSSPEGCTFHYGADVGCTNPAISSPWTVDNTENIFRFRLLCRTPQQTQTVHIDSVSSPKFSVYPVPEFYYDTVPDFYVAADKCGREAYIVTNVVMTQNMSLSSHNNNCEFYHEDDFQCQGAPIHYLVASSDAQALVWLKCKDMSHVQTVTIQGKTSQPFFVGYQHSVSPPLVYVRNGESETVTIYVPKPSLNDTIFTVTILEANTFSISPSSNEEKTQGKIVVPAGSLSANFTLTAYHDFSGSLEYQVESEDYITQKFGLESRNVKLDRIEPSSDVVPGMSAKIWGSSFGRTIWESYNFINDAQYIGIFVSGIRATEIGLAIPSSVTFTVPEGAGALNNVTVALGPNVTLAVPSDNALNLVYAEPVLTPCPKAPANFMAADTKGGDIISICGTGVGVTDYNKWTGTNKVWVGGSECKVIKSSITPTNFSCALPPGTGSNVRITVSINGAKTATYKMGVTYPKPVVSGASTANKKITRSNNIVVEILGKYFGYSKDGQRSITIGEYACKPVTWVSDGKLTCLLDANAAVGNNLPVVVTVGGQVSPIADSPVIDTGKEPTTGATGCGFPNGAQDVNDRETCNCFSGFAPSSDEGVDCKLSAKCAGKKVDGDTAGQHAPSIPKTSFSNDRLTISQTIPVVHGRRDTHIKMVSRVTDEEGAFVAQDSAMTCQYPGPLWRKTVSSLDCLDVFTASMPWSQHGICGFMQKNATSPDKIMFQTTLVTSVRDYDVFTNSYRMSSFSNLLSVTFTKQLTIATTSSNLVTVGIDESFVKVRIVSDALYDPATRQTFVTFDTTVNWPYVLDTLNPGWTPAPTNFVPDGYKLGFDLSELEGALHGVCNNEQDTSCTQRWMLTIDTINPENGVSLCNLKGKFSFAVTQLCRDVGPDFDDCPEGLQRPANITISVTHDTSVCDEEATITDASKDLTLTVISYNKDMKKEQVFQTGDIVNIELLIKSPLATVDIITFNQVVLNVEGQSSYVMYQVIGSGIMPPLVQSELASFNLGDEFISTMNGKTELAPGDTAKMTFSFIVSRQIPLLSTLTPDAPIDTSLSITVDLVYHGNLDKKRNMNVVGSSSAIAFAKHDIIIGVKNQDGKFMVGNNNDVAGEENSAQNNLTVGLSFVLLTLVSVIVNVML